MQVSNIGKMSYLDDSLKCLLVIYSSIMCNLHVEIGAKFVSNLVDCNYIEPMVKQWHNIGNCEIRNGMPGPVMAAR